MDSEGGRLGGNAVDASEANGTVSGRAEESEDHPVIRISQGILIEVEGEEFALVPINMTDEAGIKILRAVVKALECTKGMTRQ